MCVRYNMELFNIVKKFALCANAAWYLYTWLNIDGKRNFKNPIARADKGNCRRSVGGSRLFANSEAKKDEKKEGKKKKGRSGKRAREREEERKKSLSQDSRDVVGIISTFAWMRVVLPLLSTPSFPEPSSLLQGFFSAAWIWYTTWRIPTVIL